MSITFKKEKRETGLASVGHPYQNVTIKHNKKEFGTIYAPSWRTRGWRIHFARKDGVQGFKWTVVKKVFDTEEESRKFVKDHAEWFESQDLHYVNED